VNVGDLVEMRHTGDAVIFFPDLVGKIGVVVDVTDTLFDTCQTGPSRGSISLLPNFWRDDKKAHKTEQTVLVQVGADIKWYQSKDWEVLQ
jgi:hypothetical protein